MILGWATKLEQLTTRIPSRFSGYIYGLKQNLHKIAKWLLGLTIYDRVYNSIYNIYFKTLKLNNLKVRGITTIGQGSTDKVQGAPEC